MEYLKKARAYLKKIGLLDEVQDMYDDNRMSIREGLTMNAWIIQMYVHAVRIDFPKLPIDVILRGFPEDQEYSWLKRKILLLYSGKKMFDWTTVIKAIKEVSKVPNEDVKKYNQLINPVRCMPSAKKIYHP